jgi:LPS export ABC transporter permease LptG
VRVVLEDGASHTLTGDDNRVGRFERLTLKIDPASVFPTAGPLKGENEMTIAELREQIAQNEIDGISTHNQLMAIHRKFAIPVACLVFGVIGLALGATNSRGGAFGSFGFGLLVVFAYYLPTYFFPQMAKGHYLSPWLAIWLPNILLGMVAIALFLWRNRIADQPIRLPVASLLRRLRARPAGAGGSAPMRGISMIRLLDWYVGTLFVRTLLLAGGAAMAIVYISTFIDLSDKLFKGSAPWYAILEYFWFATPQFAYYTLPIAVLIATLVTIGALTRNSELVVIKACGVSLYRTAVPMLICAALVGGVLFGMDASILGPSNRRAEDLRAAMKGFAKVQPFSEPWLVGRDGTIYHIGGYDARRRRFAPVEMFEFGPEMSWLLRRTFAASGTYAGGVDAASEATWQLERGWTREFDEKGELSGLEEFSSAPRRLEPVGYFAQEPPDERFMGYAELRSHTDRLRSSGFDVAEYEVGVARKIAYPFVCLIMTLVAIPFATTIGRSGAMAGIAVGVAVALVYWGAINISAALGAGGLLAPALAAWAPNLLFGAGAAYLLLTVRT